MLFIFYAICVGPRHMLKVEHSQRRKRYCLSLTLSYNIYIEISGKFYHWKPPTIELLKKRKKPTFFFAAEPTILDVDHIDAGTCIIFVYIKHEAFPCTKGLTVTPRDFIKVSFLVCDVSLTTKQQLWLNFFGALNSLASIT